MSNNSKKSPTPPLPKAREVRDVLGHVDFGPYRVSYVNRWGDERFPWRLLHGTADPAHGILDADDPEWFREIDTYPSYREAVREARRRLATSVV